MEAKNVMGDTCERLHHCKRLSSSHIAQCVQKWKNSAINKCSIKEFSIHKNFKKINTIVKRPFSVQFSQIIALYFHMLKHCDIEVVMHSNEVIFSPFSFGNVQGFFGK